MTESNFGEIRGEKEQRPLVPSALNRVDMHPLPYTAISGEVITDYKQVPLSYRAWYKGTLIQFCATEEEAYQCLEREHKFKGHS